MGRTPAYHHVGTVLLLVAMILMLTACISAPLVNNMNFLEATLVDGSGGNGTDVSKIQAGVFGYCVGGKCMSPQISYDETMLTSLKLGDAFMTSLTYGLVMNPIAAGFTFLAFLFAFGGQSIWAGVATFFSLWSFVLTVVALGINAGVFAVAADRLNSSDQIVKGSVKFGTAFYVVVAAVVCQFISTLVICCTRRSIRNKKLKEKAAQLPMTRQDTRNSYAASDAGSEKSSPSHFRRRSFGSGSEAGRR